ncbi:CalY family protein [Microgenomates group bacterium]|nr:CalY family protein [Microgenomates group bacterium]
MPRKKDQKNPKTVLGVIALVMAVALIIGVGYAYFSDVVIGEGAATAGTLDISGTPTILHNGEEVINNQINNFNPGDIISLDTGAIINNGSKAAWIRGVLIFTELSGTENAGGSCSDPLYTDQITCENEEEVWTPAGAGVGVGSLADYLWVCTGEESQTDLITASLDVGGFAGSSYAAINDGNCSPVTSSDVNTTVFGAKDIYVAPDDVISGNLEPDGLSTVWEATSTAKIYFDAAAPNAAQNGNVAFGILIQALQYRNNTTSPTELQWATVVTTPFAL